METANAVPAATLVLLRDARDGLEVYLVRRSPKSGYMGDLYVFPGGVVDPGDREAGWERLGVPDADGLARRGLSWAEALPFGVAAIREALEEAGVFLGEAGAGDLSELLTRRAAGGLAPDWLVRGAEAGAWRPDLAALRPWSRWVTPGNLKRRYDTVYFAARAPDGCRCEPDGREVVAGRWIAPGEALTAALTGEVPLSPPTLVTLHQLLPYPTAEAVLTAAAERDLAPLRPRAVLLPGGQVIVEPWDPQFAAAEIEIDAGALEGAVLPALAPFSRIWNNGRLWRPVGVG